MPDSGGPSSGRVSASWLGTVDYEKACRLQDELACRRASGAVGDLILLLQHPPVITVGCGGGDEDVLAPLPVLRQAGIRVVHTDRGGRATYHGPGQLVIYPILELEGGDLHGYVRLLEEAAILLLQSYGLAAERVDGYPGVWVKGCKIAAVGVAVRGGITRHGLALNVAPDLDHFRLLLPCGLAGRGVTSMERELGAAPCIEQVARRFAQAFAEAFARPVVEAPPEELPGVAPPGQQPAWLWRSRSVDTESAIRQMESMLSDRALHTVCQEADCPNLAECFGHGTATFLLLGDLCTRGCRFCAVTQGRPAAPDPGEPERVAEAAWRLGLSYVVLTSVTRDDLPDGGASAFAATIHAVRRRLPEARVELLIPDFRGSCAALQAVLAAGPEVLNHNLETVPRLYPAVRPGADYQRSLRLLAWAKAQAPALLTKSGLMLGLGERVSEVLQTLADLRSVECDLLTLGQYLQPGERQVPVARYLPPDEFAWYRARAETMGFRGVSSAPLVRSSHQADALWLRARRESSPGGRNDTATLGSIGLSHLQVGSARCPAAASKQCCPGGLPG